MHIACPVKGTGGIIMFRTNSKAEQRFPSWKEEGFDRLQASHGFIQSVSMDHRLKQSGHISAVQQVQLHGTDRADGQPLFPQDRKVLERLFLGGLRQVVQKASIFRTEAQVSNR